MFLPWELQVAELRKIDHICPPAPSSSVHPPGRLTLRGDTPGEACIVCGERARLFCTCNGVAYCSERHGAMDLVWHARVCKQLAESAEDAALVRSRGLTDAVSLASRALGRRAEVPGGWSDILPRLDASDPALVRVASALLSRPLTLAHALQRLSLAPAGDLFRVHVVAAAEAEALAVQGLYENALSPWGGARCRVDFIGPDLPPDAGAGWQSTTSLDVAFHREEYGAVLRNRLGRPDLVLGFDCGLLVYPSWRITVLEVLRERLPFVLTSHRSWEQAAEVKLLESVGARLLLPPAPNPFASLSAVRSTTLANDVCHDNAFVTAVIGR